VIYFDCLWGERDGLDHLDAAAKPKDDSEFVPTDLDKNDPE
jgi:hypothetical protein